MAYFNRGLVTCSLIYFLFFCFRVALFLDDPGVCQPHPTDAEIFPQPEIVFL